MDWILYIKRVIILMFCSAWMTAQPTSILFDRYTIKNGLSNDNILSIHKDMEGYVWIGTNFGLNQFDGQVFKQFFHDPDDPTSLCDNKINTIMPVGKNEIWIGTRIGICVYNKAIQKFEKISLPDENLRSNREKEILDFYFDTIQQRIHIATHKGMFSALVTNKTLEPYKDLSSDKFLTNAFIRTICKINGNFWLGTHEGVVIYNFKDSTYKRIFTKTSNPTSFTDNNIQDIYQDYDGDIWIASWGSGLRLWNPLDSSFTDFIQDTTQYKVPVANITLEIGQTDYPDEKDLLWLASDNPSFSCFNKKTKKFTPFYSQSFLNNYTVLGNTTHLYFDQRDGLWIGSQQGLYKYDKNKQILKLRQFYHCLNHKNLLQITGMFLDPADQTENTFYFGTWNDGAYVYDFKTKVCENLKTKYQLPIVEKSYIQSITRVHDKIYIGTDISGLVAFNPQSKSSNSKSYLQGENIQELNFDKNKILWIGTSNGLFKMDVLTEKIEKIEILHTKFKNNEISSIVRGIAIDIFKNVWITFGDDADKLPFLVKIESQNQNIEFIQHNSDKKSFPITDEIRNVVIDSNGNVYIASRMGLVRFNSLKKPYDFQLLTHTFGLCSDYINEITIDPDQNIWCGTLSGLSKYFPRTNTFRNYFISEGLMIDEIRGVSYQGDKLIISSWGQIQYITKENLSSKLAFPNLEILEFEVNQKPFLFQGRKVENGDHIHLSYEENSIKILMSSLTFTNPDIIKFKYRMTGFEQQFNENHSGNIQYKLNPGSYTFEYTGSNADGMYNPEIQKLYIHIATPFWKSIWFFALISATVIGIVYYYFWQKDQSRIKLEKLRYQIARDLHDDMGSNLSNIKMISELEILKNPQANDTSYSKIAEKSRIVMENMSDIVWSINPNNDDLSKVITKIQVFAIEILESKNIELKMDIPSIPDKIEINLDQRRHFHMICKEAFNNIAKYSKADMATFSILLKNQRIYTVISDNGVGFHSMVQGNGNGLVNMRSRIADLGGKIHIDSGADNGTKIEFDFPIT